MSAKDTVGTRHGRSGTSSSGAATSTVDSSAPVAAGGPITDRALAWLLLIGGTVGLSAAFILAIEKIKLISDPGYVPSCSINPVLSCGSIMSTEQAEVLGFPNPLIGIAAFPLVAATGIAMLAGARLPRWYWLGLQVGVTCGAMFVCWLIYQSLYRIGALCPYCMVVWAVVLPMFWYVTMRNTARGVLGASIARSRATRVLGDSHALVLVLVLLLIVGLVGEQFWFYWSTLL